MPCLAAELPVKLNNPLMGTETLDCQQEELPFYVLSR